MADAWHENLQAVMEERRREKVRHSGRGGVFLVQLGQQAREGAFGC